MPKKTAATEAAVTEETSASAEKADPTLLGVGVPLNLTLSSAKTVADAWKETFLALREVVVAKFKKKESEAVPTPVASA
jgi:hypothetical protein